jgi:hypothetical protein
VIYCADIAPAQREKSKSLLLTRAPIFLASPLNLCHCFNAQTPAYKTTAHPKQRQRSTPTDIGEKKEIQQHILRGFNAAAPMGLNFKT